MSWGTVWRIKVDAKRDSVGYEETYFDPDRALFYSTYDASLEAVLDIKPRGVGLL